MEKEHAITRLNSLKALIEYRINLATSDLEYNRRVDTQTIEAIIEYSDELKELANQITNINTPSNAWWHKSSENNPGNIK